MKKLKEIIEIVVPNASALAVVGSFLALIFLLFFKATNIPPAIKDIMLIFVGGLGATFNQLFQYWFGSSSGSKAKSESATSAEPKPPIL